MAQALLWAGSFIAHKKLCSGRFLQERTLLKTSAPNLQEGQRAGPGFRAARNNVQRHCREGDRRLATPLQFKKPNLAHNCET